MAKTEKKGIFIKKEILKKGSVFPALSYLATGYLISFFMSTFLGVYLATALEGAGPYAEAIRGGSRVIAYAVIALVLAGTLFDFMGKKIDGKQAITTAASSVLFIILVALSYTFFEMLV